MIYAVCDWLLVKNRKVLLTRLEEEIDRLIGNSSHGCFVVILKGPMGSDDALEIESQSNHRLNARQCPGCEKDDRREWTEPSEHTCDRHKV